MQTSALNNMKALLKKYNQLSKPVKASICFLICSILQKGISVIVTPIFTRLMSTEEYGQFSVFYSWLNIIAVVVSLYMYYGVFTQGLVKYESDRSVFSSSMLGLHTTLVLLWSVIYFLFRNYWNSLFSLSTLQMILLLILIWTSGVFNYWAAEQRVELNYKSLVVLTICISIIKPVLGVIAVVLSDNKVLARIIMIAFIELIAFSGLFIKQLIKGKCFYSSKYWKHSLMFAIPLMPHYLSQSVLSGADRIMIKEMIGEGEAGIYGLACSVAFLMTLLNAALSQTVDPWIFKKIKDKKYDEIQKVAFGALLLISVANLFVIAFAPEVVFIFAPKSYHDAIWVIPPVSASLFFQFSYNLFADFEFYFEQKKFISIATVISAGLNILLNYVFIGIFGYIAAGYTTLVCYILYAIGHYFMMRWTCKKYITDYDKSIYDVRLLVVLSSVFLLFSLLMLITYNMVVLRYGIILFFIIIGVCFRKRVKETIVFILSIRKQNK